MKQGNPADIVYDYIKNQIVTKAIYPGTRIVEEELVREPVSAGLRCARR